MESVEPEATASPFHDWNQRITAECYAPNAHARLLDAQGYLRALSNNYARMSFNFGPTLLDWLERYDVETYRAILQADRISQNRYHGHGSAMAQVYNHIIMPLASGRDKETEIRWGIHDFVHRFGRNPEGMWLAETAVDYETLELLAAHGILFTVLSPQQVERIRDPKTMQWTDVSSEMLDTTRPYRIRLASNLAITVFFYHAPLSRAVAFEGLLNNGADFAARLASGFTRGDEDGQIVNIATDGETYGHHHRFGEMALAYALEAIEHRPDVCLTNYGEYLAGHPAEWEADIRENTSWSCAHGIERWRSDCGCHTGLHPKWNQQWRQPLRDAMDGLRDAVVPLIDNAGRQWFKDPWAARNDYIEVLLSRDETHRQTFLHQHQAMALSEVERVQALALMELCRHLLLMYTSCGWFFDDIAGIEAVQVMKYAARAIELTNEVFGINLTASFTARLAQAVANETGDSGRRIFEEHVLPKQIDLARVAVHFSLIHVMSEDDRSGPETIYCYHVWQHHVRIWRSGAIVLKIGRVRVKSQLTLASQTFVFGALHLGDHNVSAGVRADMADDVVTAMEAQLGHAFDSAEFPEVLRLLDQWLQGRTYSLRHLFRDEQEAVMKHWVKQALFPTIEDNRQHYERHVPLMRFLKEIEEPIPQTFYDVAAVAIRANLEQALSQDPVRFDIIKRWIQEAKEWQIWREGEEVLDWVTRLIERLTRTVQVYAEDIKALEDLAQGVRLAYDLPMTVDLRFAQMAVFQLHQEAKTWHPALWHERMTELEKLLMIHADPQHID